MIEITQ